MVAPSGPECGRTSHFRITEHPEIASLSALSIRWTSTPDIVKAIVRGDEPDGLTMRRLMKQFPVDWNEQRMLFHAF